MKSVKRGRGPSYMSGVMSILVGIFGVVWTVIAGIEAGPFALFGIVFIAISVVNAVYHFRNASGKNRYSEFDITDDGEEPDPLDRRFKEESSGQSFDSDLFERPGYCPYCGKKVKKDFEYCSGCGKRLPR